MTDPTQEFAEGDDHTEAGDLIEGRYRLEEPLGGGVTATTWRAHDPVLGRDVAVKIWTDASEDAHRSQQDELGAARLLDPALNELLDAGTHDGRPFLVREIAQEHPADPTPPLSSPAVVPSPVAPPAGTSARSSKGRRDRVVTTSIVAMVVAALLVAGGLVARPDSDEPTANAADGIAVAPTEVASFDPEGDGRENPQELGAVVDGNPGTTWSSDRYNSRKFGNLKPGLGLVLTFSPARPLTSVLVDSEAGGWSAQIHAADSPGEALAEWGPAVDRVATARASEEFDLEGRTVGAVLIWFTDLGSESNRLTIRELRVEAAR